jgi:hypothetical protein
VPQEFGGPLSYLDSIGFCQDDLQRLRALRGWGVVFLRQISFDQIRFAMKQIPRLDETYVFYQRLFNCSIQFA